MSFVRRLELELTDPQIRGYLHRSGGHLYNGYPIEAERYLINSFHNNYDKFSDFNYLLAVV